MAWRVSGVCSKTFSCLPPIKRCMAADRPEQPGKVLGVEMCGSVPSLLLSNVYIFGLDDISVSEASVGMISV
jgi:hypothetical protein